MMAVRTQNAVLTTASHAVRLGHWPARQIGSQLISESGGGDVWLSGMRLATEGACNPKMNAEPATARSRLAVLRTLSTG